VKPIRLAIIGSGRLGTIHARLAAANDQFQVVAVVDSDAAARQRISDQLGLPTVADYTMLGGEVEAAVIAVPTQAHYLVARDCLERGLHTLVEKPLTTSLRQADHLIEMASQRGLVLQVGHVERCNPAYVATRALAQPARYIEATRTSGFTFRSIDIGAVLDLMIHDIDLALDLAASEVTDVDAVGVSIFGRHEDMAQARLRFRNGVVANLTASRASFTACRQFRWVSETGFVGLDLAQPSAVHVEVPSWLARREDDIYNWSPAQQQAVRERLFTDVLPRREVPVSPGNAIVDEQRQFAAAIRTGVPPAVTGTDARQALAVAERILEAIHQHRWTDEPPLHAARRTAA